MAVLDTSGTSSGSSGAFGGLIQISTSSGNSAGLGSATTPIVRLMSAVATAIGTSNGSAAIVRRYAPSGDSAGRTQVMPIIAAKYGVLGGTASSLTEAEAYISDRDIYRSLTEKLPSIFANDLIIQGLLRIFAVEMTKLSATIAWVLDQRDVDTASDDELSRFEKELDVKLGLNWTADQRREVIKQRLTKPSLLTKNGFKQQMRQFYVCGVDENYTEQRVETTILSKRGVPVDIASMEDAVERVLPAHLEHEFIYTWLPVGEIAAVELTCGGIDTFQSIGELETTFLIPFEEEGGEE